MDVRAKSVDYLNASQKLIDMKEHLHCSIALSYYSVFIYMKHLIAHVKKTPISYSESEFSGQRAHVKVREVTMAKLSKINQDEWKSLDKRIQELHDVRVEADYKQRHFDLDEAMKWHSEAVELRKKLKYFYNNLLEEAFK